MGVPALFSLLVKNYPDIIFYNPEQKIDNLYLDMNGAIHPCCYRILDKCDNAEDLEDKMLIEIIDYLKYIIDFVKPRKTLYIAIDGPAPRAKIEQQRKRRFKSAKEKRLIAEVKKKHGVKTVYWDSCKITPGTIFMDKVNDTISEFVKTITGIEVIFSNSNIPQEGEHKIYQHIRNLKNKNICAIYGLDADLIFLGLASKRKNVFLLRESNYLDQLSEDIELHYFSIDLLKKYLINSIDIKVNTDKFINDFVVICFLLGNDFLPHLPGLNIKKGGFEVLLNIYLETFKELKIFLIDGKNINVIFFSKILEKLSDKEHELLQNKTSSFEKKYENDYDEEINKIKKAPAIYDCIMFDKDGYRERYYNYCFVYSSLDNVERVCQNYFEGIKWTLHYYLEKNISWTWHYEFTHAPFISDLSKYFLKENINKIKFDKGKPYKPFEQLLLVLPPSSHQLLPKSYQNLITDFSPIIDLYPTDFVEDYHNIYYRWEAIPYLPYVDYKRIKKAISKLKLDKDEIKRNTIY